MPQGNCGGLDVFVRAMISIHFVCRDRQNLNPVKHPLYESGHWDLTPEEAKNLVGGMIYLHQTKTKLSYFGGRIDDYRSVETENARSQRVVFIFTYRPEGKGAKWRGADHARAWTSGIIPDQPQES